MSARPRQKRPGDKRPSGARRRSRSPPSRSSAPRTSRIGRSSQRRSISPALPRAIWDRALGDVARDILGRPSRQFRARMCELGWRLADGPGEAPAAAPGADRDRPRREPDRRRHRGRLEPSARRHRLAPPSTASPAPSTPAPGCTSGRWTSWIGFRCPTPTRERIRDARRRRRSTAATSDRRWISRSRLDGCPARLIYRTVATSTMLKTGALMELAAVRRRAGGRRSDDCLEALAQFGRRLGLGLQMLDDFGNLYRAHDRRQRHEGAGGSAQRSPHLALGARGPRPGRRRIFAAAGERTRSLRVRRSRRHAGTRAGGGAANGRRNEGTPAGGALSRHAPSASCRAGSARETSSACWRARSRDWRPPMGERAGGDRRERIWRAGGRHPPAGGRRARRDVRGARPAGRSRLRLPRPGLHVRRRADRHHRAPLPGGAVRAGGRAA